MTNTTPSRALSDSTTPLLERGVSGGSTLSSLGNWSQSPTGSMVHTVTSPSNKRGGALTPVEFSTQSEVLAGRLRDAQRMDAWFQRSLSKRAASGPLSPATQRAMPAPPQTAAAAASPPLQNPLDLVKSAETVLPGMSDPAPHAASPSPATEDHAASSGATFSLEVQLSGDVLGMLKFCLNDRIDAMCETFVTENRLRPIFLAPLVAHAELMVHMDKRVDSVDAIDLL